MKDQKKRIALITGANRGLGLETARQLGKQGYAVIIAARSSAKVEKAADALRREGIDAHPVMLDVTNPQTFPEATKQVERNFGHLDVLVNNAGIAEGTYAQPISQVTSEQVLKTFQTNTLGPLLVTQAFFPLLKKSLAPRIVNVSSGMGQLTDMNGGVPAYRISKTALNAVTKLFAVELADTPAKVNAVCPGWVRTDMGGPNAERSVDIGAKGIVWAATLDDDGPTGGFFRDGKRLDW